MRPCALLLLLFAFACDHHPEVTVRWTLHRFDASGTIRQLSCADARVDTIKVSICDGRQFTGDCSLGGYSFQDVPALPCHVCINGYRSGSPEPIVGLAGQLMCHKFMGPSEDYHADLFGFPAPLEVAPVLEAWDGTGYVAVPTPACVRAAVDTLTYEVRDVAGILLATGQASCVTDPGRIAVSEPAYFGTGVVMDDLTIRMQGWRNTDPLTRVADSCDVTFRHAGEDVGASAAVIDLLSPAPAACP